MCHRSIYLSGALLCGALCLSPASLRAQKIETLQLCNTGRTAKALPPDACLATELVSPINSEGGGPIVDGNWDIAVPYPYGSYNSAPPDPCIEDFGYLPVPVSAVSSTAWLNPDDGKSQWIEPAGGPSNLPGWYVYVTAFAVPPAFDGSGDYTLNVSGKFLVDDSPDMIYVSSHSAGFSYGWRFLDRVPVLRGSQYRAGSESDGSSGRVHVDLLHADLLAVSVHPKTWAWTHVFPLARAVRDWG
jgi:hypothetical protein